MAKILLATMGSTGDVLPFIAIGDALKRIGHQPVIASQGLHRSLVVGNGLEFRPVRPSLEDVAKNSGRNLGDLVAEGTQDPMHIVRTVHGPFTPHIFEDVINASEGAALIVAHNWMMGAIIAAEAKGIPLVRAMVSPLLLQSAANPSETPGVPYRLRPGSEEDIAYNRRVREIARREMRRQLEPIHAFRRRLGLAEPSPDFVFNFGRPDNATSILAAYSPALAPPAKDHPQNTVVSGFPYFDAATAINPALESLDRFLQTGSRPVILTLGSFVAEASADFHANGLAACRALGLRSILVAGKAEVARLAHLARPDTFICAHAPYRAIFPHACAIVHHGGTGTVGFAMKAGKPQLVVPMLADQVDNAHRLTNLGVARRLMVKRKANPEVASVARLTDEIRILLTEPRYREAGAQIAAAVKGEDGAMAAARHIDALVAGGR